MSRVVTIGNPLSAQRRTALFTFS